MNVISALNFKNAVGTGFNLYASWVLVTLMNAATVFVLIGAGLLAWRCFA